MNAYTMGQRGISVKGGKIVIGQQGRGRRQVSIPIPEGGVIEVGKLRSIPGPGGSVLLYIPDQSGFRGGWRLRCALSPQEWDSALAIHLPEGCHPGSPSARTAQKEYLKALERPFGGTVIAEGFSAQGDAGGMGGGPEFLLVLRDGEAVECVRWGRLYDSPSVIRLENVGGDIVQGYPWEEAEERKAARRLSSAMEDQS